MKLSEYKRVHCLGIGGIGLSALARYCMSCGAIVSGTDISGSRITDEFRSFGLNIFNKHEASNITDDIDLVIYTIAITYDNEELKEARDKGIKCLTYPEALGFLTKEYKTIAVCGTHGKTTTTGMVAEMMTSTGLSPTVIVGSLLKSGTNFIKGNSKYLVIEACEYRRSFLNFSPTYVIVTNIDEDHLDYYKDLNDIKSAFQEFAIKIPKEGVLITHEDVSLDTIGKKINADEINVDNLELSVLGKHNKENAKLALALAYELNLDEEKAKSGLKKFTGTWRRMEYHGETEKGVKVYDDYAHHPTEIKATLQAIREKYPKGEYVLNVFFQPHLFSRTKLLLDDFAKSFTDADEVFILPIYHAREEDDKSVSHIDLVNSINNIENKAKALNSLNETIEVVKSLNNSKNIVITVGAGDIYTILKEIDLNK